MVKLMSNNTIWAYKGQTLQEHVNEMLKYWEEIKVRYIETIKRSLSSLDILLSEEEIDRLMKILIISHDVGKATKFYQEEKIEKNESIKGFRHELVSSYVTYEIIKHEFNLSNDKKELLALISALAIMLHHEPILMGQIKEIKKEELSAEVVIDKLKTFNGFKKGIKDFFMNYKQFFKNETNIIKITEETTSEKIRKNVFEMSIKARHFPYSPKLRFIVGTLLLPIVICDYKGAESREGPTSKFAEILKVEKDVIQKLHFN